MPLKLETRTASDFVPYIKYDAKAGRWFTKSGEEGGLPVEVKNMTAIMDLANIELGWFKFSQGAAPNIVMDNGSVGPQPSPEHRRGFKVLLYGEKYIGGLREMQANSTCACNAIKDLYDNQFELAPEAGEGLVPVVSCVDTTQIKSSQGVNYEPVLKITQWVKRPDALKAKAPTAAKAAVPPPLVKAAAPSSNSDEEEF